MRNRLDKRFAGFAAGMTRRGRRPTDQGAVQSHRAGVAYSLSVVLLLPVYVLLVCLLVEVVMLLNAQTGVDYAAWSAARAAAVWVPAEASTAGAAERNIDMVRRAAVNALSVWATDTGAASTSADQQGAEAMVAISRAAEGPEAHPAAWIRSKWHSANDATHVEFDPPLSQLRSANFRDPVELSVTVHYARPFFTPGIGRILGRRSATGYVRDLQATTTITVEFPRTRSGGLGWDYDSRPAAMTGGNKTRQNTRQEWFQLFTKTAAEQQ